MDYKLRLTSKKFLFAIGFAVVASVSAVMGDPIDPDLLNKLGKIVMAWIGVEGFADIMAISKRGAASIEAPPGKSKLTSRKFWVMLLAGPLMLANSTLGMPVPEETVMQVITTVGAWLGVQGIEDGFRRWKLAAAEEEVAGPSPSD